MAFIRMQSHLRPLQYSLKIVYWLGAFLALVLSAGPVLAKARPHHQHEDFLNEKDLWIGLKGGPMVTSYSSVRNENASLSEVPAKVGYFGGVALQLIYDLPRIEADLMVLSRGGISPGSWVYTLAVPVLLKFPIEIEEGTDFVAGLGAQNDFTVGGMQNLRPSLFGPVASVGATVDAHPVVFEFEARYVYGIRNLSRSVHGGRPQDIQFMLGVFWHL